MPVNIDSVEGYGQQPRLADVQPTDVIPWERGGNPASVLVQTLAEFLAENIVAGVKIDFGASPVGLSPIVGDVFFDTDDGIVYQYELAGWAAKLDFVSSAELGAAIANFLTQTTGDARYPLKTATDPYPVYLTQAEAAALFSPIGGDAQGGLRYNYVVTTGTATTGQIRFNNATLASVTALSIHESDRNSAAQSEILDVVAVGTRIQVALENDEEIYAWFRVSGAVVDNGSDRTIPVAFVSSAGTFAAGEVTINFLQIQGVSSGGGASGLKFTLNTTAGTPAAGEIRSTNLAAGGTIAINPVDTQANASDVLGRLGVGAIVHLGKDGANWARGTVTTAWTAGSGSFAIGDVRVAGAIANSDTVYLSIASDAPATSSGGGDLVRQTITSSQSASNGIAYICDSSSLIELTLPSGVGRFAVANKGTGGFKIRKSATSVLYLDANLVDSTIKYVGNNSPVSYAEIFAVDSDRWIVTSKANVSYGVDIVNNAKSLIHFNETVSSSSIVDTVSSGRVITLLGSAVTAASGKFGNCLSLNGTSQGANFSLSDPIGTQDWCVEIWAKANTGSINGQRNLFNLNRSGTRFIKWSWAGGGSGNYANPNVEILASAGGLIELNRGFNYVEVGDNTWHHYAVSKSGTTFRAFYDGTLISSANNSAANDFGTAAFDVRLGHNNQGYWAGALDEFRITIGDAVYTANFTPPTTEFSYP